MQQKILCTLKNIDQVAHNILQHITTPSVCALHGTMGAGKTTLVSALCKCLGVTEKISSPTYSIITEHIGNYNGSAINICHIDLYRLKNTEEVYNAGVVEYLQSNKYYCFVEWPSIAPEIFNTKTINIYLQALNETEREIIIEKNN